MIAFDVAHAFFFSRPDSLLLMLLGHDTDERAATQRQPQPPAPQDHPPASFPCAVIDAIALDCSSSLLDEASSPVPATSAGPPLPSPSSFELPSSLASSCCAARVGSRHPSPCHWNPPGARVVAVRLTAVAARMTPCNGVFVGRRECSTGAGRMDEGAATNSVERPTSSLVSSPSANRTRLPSSSHFLNQPRGGGGGHLVRARTVTSDAGRTCHPLARPLPAERWPMSNCSSFEEQWADAVPFASGSLSQCSIASMHDGRMGREASAARSGACRAARERTKEFRGVARFAVQLSDARGLVCHEFVAAVLLTFLALVLCPASHRRLNRLASVPQPCSAHRPESPLLRPLRSSGFGVRSCLSFCLRVVCCVFVAPIAPTSGRGLPAATTHNAQQTKATDDRWTLGSGSQPTWLTHAAALVPSNAPNVRSPVLPLLHLLRRK
jgi:hypothetical protein